MAEHKKSDDGRGQPPEAQGRTAEPQVLDSRLIPGGSLEAAKTPIGMNAVDREDLPSYGVSTGQTDYPDTPNTAADRPAHPEEPGSAASTANAPGVPRAR